MYAQNILTWEGKEYKPQNQKVMKCSKNISTSQDTVLLIKGHYKKTNKKKHYQRRLQHETVELELES